jgi:hypothetical protein
MNTITTMTKKMGVIVIAIILSAQAYSAQIGCQRMLKYSSRNWVDTYCIESAHHNCNTMDIVNALSLYGTCYIKRTLLLKQKLDLNGTGPLMGANANYNDFSRQLNDFTTLALKATSGEGTYDTIRTAYAQLYQNQFAYLFYQSYIKAVSNHEPQNKRALAQLNRAKHYLEHCMKRLPSVRVSFNKLMIRHKGVSPIPELSIYLYAISILQSAADPEFSPPPF